MTGIIKKVKVVSHVTSRSLRELKQQRRRRLRQRKRHLKNEFALPQTISFDSSNVDMNSKGLYMYHISRKEKSVAVLCSRPRQNVKLARPFHVVVVQRRLRNVQKRVMHVQSCCFAIAFLPFSLPSPSSLLKLPNVLYIYRYI